MDTPERPPPVDHADTSSIAVELVILAEARNEVGAADHKASMVLAVLGIGFSALLGGLIARDWSPRDLDALGAVAWSLGTVLAVASLASAAGAVWPRFTVPATAHEIFYWGHVASLRTPHDLESLLERRPPSLSDRTRHQMFELSHIVARKYRWVRVAMGLAALSGPFFLVAGIWGG